MISHRFKLFFSFSAMLVSHFAWPQCVGTELGAYPKTLLIGGAPLQNQSDTRLGAIGDIDIELSRRLAAKLNADNNHLILDWSERRMPEIGRLSAGNIASYGNLLMPDAQFVLEARVHNLQLEKDSDLSWFKRWLRRPAGLIDRRANQPRIFSMSVRIVNRYTGELIFDKYYEKHANWGFAKRVKLSAEDPRLWQSDFGTRVDRVLASLAADINRALNCQPLMAKIVRIQGEEFEIAASREQNLQLGARVLPVKTASDYRLLGTERDSIATLVRLGSDRVAARLGAPFHTPIRVGDLVIISQPGSPPEPGMESE